MAKINLHPNLDRDVKKGVAWAVHAFTTCGIVLGFLAILTISVVAFAIMMRTERVAARNYSDVVRARQLVRVALARAQ